TLNLSESKLNYPVTYIEIEEQLSYQHNGFNVEAYMLNHGIPSFGYRVEAPYKSGKINVEALKKFGLEPGPKYQDVKNNETFEYKGTIYNSNDFKDDATKGPVVAIFGDTMPCKNELLIARDATVMVHESTYIEGDKTLANSYHHRHIYEVFEVINKSQITNDDTVMVNESKYIEVDKTLANSYHHSHIDDVFELIREAQVDYSLITHISNRYTKEEVNEISKRLKSLDDTPPFNFVSDFDSWQF